MSLDGDYDPTTSSPRSCAAKRRAPRCSRTTTPWRFMDVFPQGRGHTLVIHKRARGRNLLDVEPEPSSI